MARITASTVNTVRGLVVWGLRAASIVLLAAGGYLFLTRVLWTVGNAIEPQFAFYNDGSEVGAPFAGLGLMVVGAAIGVFAPLLARWTIAVPPGSCPRCGYEGAGGAATCPECGLDTRDA